MAAEKKLQINAGERELTAILNLPDGIKRPPAILLLHGFTGQKDEFQIAGHDVGLFAYTADELAKQGFASLRIDFSGSGESKGDWADTTFSKQIDDAVTAFDYLQSLASIDARRIGVVGYSQGGLVAGHLVARRPETSAAVLWAPVTNPLSTYSTIMGAQTVESALAASDDTLITANLSWGGETKLKAGFFKEMPEFSPIGTIGKYPGPLRVIVGKRETIVTPQPGAGQVLLNYHNGIDDLVLVDSDHDWNAADNSMTVEDILVPKTVEWFKEHIGGAIE
ncbi:alpha/beta fold hydrolase [Brucella sp. NBRC 12950]|uniref:alpha/beta hydrolase family protein n=1 Tax=Brucella sp. NBRC 12950 TaxID=2994518 RepID=UPI00255528B3|nr:alpha/beta fold hydrolase [Brucella sp. NBRC 12950]